MIVIERGVPEDWGRALQHSPVSGIADAEKILREELGRSNEVWSAKYDEEIACIMGLYGTSMLSDRAYLWMLHTDIVEDHKFLFVRHSQMWVQDVLKRYAEIWGIAIYDNVPGIRWLRWLGAEFDYPQNGKARFTIRAKPNG